MILWALFTEYVCFAFALQMLLPYNNNKLLLPNSKVLIELWNQATERVLAFAYFISILFIFKLCYSSLSLPFSPSLSLCFSSASAHLTEAHSFPHRISISLLYGRVWVLCNPGFIICYASRIIVKFNHQIVAIVVAKQNFFFALFSLQFSRISMR